MSLSSRTRFQTLSGSHFIIVMLIHLPVFLIGPNARPRRSPAHLGSSVFAGKTKLSFCFVRLAVSVPRLMLRSAGAAPVTAQPFPAASRISIRRTFSEKQFISPILLILSHTTHFRHRRVYRLFPCGSSLRTFVIVNPPSGFVKIFFFKVKFYFLYPAFHPT